MELQRFEILTVSHVQPVDQQYSFPVLTTLPASVIVSGMMVKAYVLKGWSSVVAGVRCQKIEKSSSVITGEVHNQNDKKGSLMEVFLIMQGGFE